MTIPDPSSVQPRTFGPIVRLLRRIYPERRGLSLFDVGAYEGEFTREVLDEFPESRAVLFEPTPDVCRQLRARFAGNPRVIVCEVALGKKEAPAELHLMDPPYTNSLLPPTTGRFTRIPVMVRRLDAVAAELGASPPLDLVKVDTQGNDLRVLEGGIRIIQEQRPLLHLEAIYVPLYQGQVWAHDLERFVQALGYRLLRIDNVFCTEDGVVAFADLFFAPTSLHRALTVTDTRFVPLEWKHAEDRVPSPSPDTEGSVRRTLRWFRRVLSAGA